jgi:KAP family P-loop domain protein
MKKLIDRWLSFFFGRKKPNLNIDKDEPMQKIINVVKDYLTRETNNALLITGEWGVGKTYFFNNILSKKIEGINIKGDASSTYTSIRVSLFGVTNIDDLERRIVAPVRALLINGVIELGEKALNYFLSSIGLGVFFSESFSKLIDEFKATNNNIIKSKANNLVICFDDLERISKDFHIENLIGYVNNLSENYDFKVILIGNTDKIEDNNFKEIKEKLIGVEIEFDNDIKLVFDNIVKNKFHEEQSKNNKYENFLEEEKDLICSFFNDKYKNIRTLLIVLESYKHIYSAIIGLNSAPLREYRNDLIKSTLLFTIAIAIEFKKGNLSKKDKERMNDWDTLDFDNLLGGDESVQAETKEIEGINLEKFRNKYYMGSIYKFYETIFDYIVGIDTFIEKKFIKEVKQKYGISQNENLPDCYKALNEISTDVIFKISNKEYKNRLNEVLQYVDKGEYELDRYVNTYIHIIKYGDPLEIGEENLKKRVIAGIEKGKNNLEYNHELANMSQYLHFPNSMDEYAREILQFCLAINEEKQQEIHKNESVALEKLLKPDKFEEFKKVAVEKATVPIFAYIDSKLIFEFYEKNIPLREDIANFIKERVITYASPAVLDLEKNFYTQLQQSIEKKANQLKLGPEWVTCSKFNELLKNITNHL